MKLFISTSITIASVFTANAQRANFTAAQVITPTQTINTTYNSNTPACFKFVATNTNTTVLVQSAANFDANVQIAQQKGKRLHTLQTQDNTYSNDLEELNLTNLTVGNEYFVVVNNYTTANSGQFSITINPTVVTQVPVNDEPSGAIELQTTMPLTKNATLYTAFSTLGASNNNTLAVPSNCADANTNIANDVWFKVKVPASGAINITPQYGVVNQDASIAVYTGNPSALSLQQAVDDNDYGILPTVTQNNLTPNTYIYVRYWANAQARGNGAITVFAGTNDGTSCANALEVCDFNGVQGRTSLTQVATKPCNMEGNKTGGIFGNCPDGTLFGTACGGSPLQDVTIDHNKWVKFTASQTSISLSLDVTNCTNNNAKGVQIQIFSNTGGCSGSCNFAAVSSFTETNSVTSQGGTVSSSSITASALTPGQSYYLMIDAYGNNICDFDVKGSTGVSFGEAIPDKTSICVGESATITAPTGATSYSWTATPGPNPSGTSNAITVSPTVTTTYTVDMAGYCNNKQSTVTITVGNLTPSISPAATTACKGGTSTYTVTAIAGSTYTWVVAGGTGTSTTNSITVTWGAGATGSVKVTQTNGACSGTDQINVTLTAAPTAGFSYPNSPVCDDVLVLPLAMAAGATKGDFTSSSPLLGGNTLGNGTVFPPVTLPGTYTMTNTVTVAGCPVVTATATYTVNPTPKPTITTTNSSVCANATGTYTIPATTNAVNWTVTGGVISGGQATSGLTVTWGAAGTGTIAVTETNSFGCVGTDNISVTINPLPLPFVATLSPNDTICAGDSVIISTTPQPNIVSTVYSTIVGGTALGTVNYNTPPLNNTIKYYIETKSTAGCVAKTSRDSITIVVNPRPAPPILALSPNDSICSGLTDTIKVTPVTGVVTNVYSSLTGGISLGTLNYITPPIIATITYYFETKIATTGCTSARIRDSLKITVLPRPAHPTVTLAPNDSICLHDSTKLKATVIGTNTTINWYNTPNDNTSLGKDSVKVSPPATQYYYVEVKNEFGCKANEKRDSTKVIVLPLPDLPKLTAVLKEICEGDSIVLKAMVNPTTATIFWLNGTAWKDTIKRGTDFTSPNLTSSTTYYMGSISKDGCKNDGAFAILPIIVNPLPHVSITANLPDNTVYEGQTIIFDAQPETYKFYNWYVENSPIYGGEHLFNTQELLDGQSIKVLVTTDKGCKNWGDNTIKVKVLPISNAFTPNNDGKNDLFLKGIDIQIFNRWGQLLFTGNEGWDGKYKGNTVSPGTYYYMLKIKKLNSEEIVEKSGSVTVVLD